MGLRGTASIDYVISGKFVPGHRAFEYPFLPDRYLRKAFAQGLIQLGQPGLVAFASGIGLRALAELIVAAPKTKRLLAEGRLRSRGHHGGVGVESLTALSTGYFYRTETRDYDTRHSWPDRQGAARSRLRRRRILVPTFYAGFLGSSPKFWVRAQIELVDSAARPERRAFVHPAARRSSGRGPALLSGAFNS